MENEGEEKSGEKGKENAGTKEEEEEKAAGKRGNGTGKAGATRLKTRIRGTESPRTEIGRTVKNSRKKESLERKTHKENIGHVSGGVHKGEINKEEAKDVKEEEVPRQERRIQLDRGRTTRKVRKTHWSNGTNWNGEMEGAARMAKRRRHWNRGTHKESMEDAQEATHENTSYI